MPQRKSPPPPPKRRIAAKPQSAATPTNENPRGGEGDYESAERYQREATSFAQSGRVEPAAEAARAAVEGDEATELADAEAKGRARSKGDDPRDDAE